MRALASFTRQLASAAPKGRPKLFRERENEYFHGVMENLPAYRETVLPKPDRENACLMLSSEKTWPFDEFCDRSLKTQGSSFDIENDAHKYLTQQVATNVHLANEDQLKDCLICLSLWPPTPGTTTKNFMQLWNALDRECTKRSPSWKPQMQLLLADCFFHLRLSRITSYNRAVLHNLAVALPTLPAHNLVQYLFLSNLQRMMVESVDTVLQDRLRTLVLQMSVEEAGIICQGFFKCKKTIQDKVLLRTVTEKTVEQLPNVSSIVVCAILKEIRYSSTTRNLDSYKDLLFKCQRHMAHWDMPTINQLYNLVSGMKIFQPEFLLQATNYISSRLDRIRLKEISSLLYGQAVFALEDKHFYEKVAQQLRDSTRAAEIERYHHCLVSCVWYFALGEFFPEDLVRLALDESKINLDKRHGDIKFELAGLHHSVFIESSTYKGPFLSEDTLRRCMENVNLKNIQVPSGTMQQRITTEIYESLRGRQTADIVRVLPHMHSPDIVFDIDVDTKSVRKARLQKLSYNIVKPKDRAWVVVVQGKSSFCHDSRRLTGLARAKIRQLTRLGFSVIQVPYYDSQRFSSREKILDVALAGLS